MSAEHLLWMIPAAALLCAALLVPLRSWLKRHALAHPNERSSHKVPTPQGAGIAVVCATVAVVLAAAHLLAVPLWASGLGLVALATALIAAVGAWDDIRAIPVLPRLALQTVLAAVAVATLPDAARLAPGLPLLAERAIVLIALVWFINLTNFMDGLDWITAAEFVPLTAALVMLGFMDQLPLPALLCALALLGALLGFAPFNRPVASIFLGDVGSLAIGLLCGWMLLVLASVGHWAAALILPLYYLADATLTLLRRLVRGEPFWRAHRTHFYQRATDRGFTVLATVGHVFVLNLLLAGLAVATVLNPAPAMQTAAFAAAVFLVGVLLMRFARRR